MREGRAALAFAVSPLIVVAWWSIGADGHPAPTIAWLLNAVFAYPSFAALLGLCWALSKWVLHTSRPWQHSLSTFGAATIASGAYKFWIFSNTYSSYQSAKTVIVANSHITPEGARLLLQSAVEDGVAFAAAYVLYELIRGGANSLQNRVVE